MRAFERSDYAQVAAWYRDRGQGAPPERCLPCTGLIEPGVAAGFLYSTDSAVCFIDCLVSNPFASEMARGRALHAIADALVKEAERLDFAQIIITSREPGVIRTAGRMAFKSAGQFAMLCRATQTDERATNTHQCEV